MDVAASATIWLAVLGSILTAVGTMYGMVRTYLEWRLDKARRLNDAAAIAVRRTEAAFVRPLLKERMLEVLQSVPPVSSSTGSVIEYRSRLFCALQRCVGLRCDEKKKAQEDAVRFLVEHLRAMPSPPLRLKTDRDVARYHGRLRELVELAYNLRPRPSADMIRGVGEFCRVDVEVVAPPPAAMALSHRPPYPSRSVSPSDWV